MSKAAVNTISNSTQIEPFDTVAVASTAQTSFLIQIHPLERRSRPVRLDGQSFTLGRDPQCSLQIHDKAVSRLHARIQKRDGHFEITDLQSKNGLYLNQHRVAGARLQSGDRIRLGEHVFIFLNAFDDNEQPDESV